MQHAKAGNIGSTSQLEKPVGSSKTGSSNFLAKLKPGSRALDSAAGLGLSKQMLHLKFAAAVGAKHSSGHLQTASSASSCTTLHLQGLSSKAQNKHKLTFQALTSGTSKAVSLATVKAIKDDLAEKEKEIQDIETKLRVQVPRLTVDRLSELNASGNVHGGPKTRGHHMQPSAPPPLSAREERVHRISPKPASTAGSYLPQAARQYPEPENQEESTKTGKEVSESTKVQELKGQLKTLPVGVARGGKLPTHKSSASHYHTVDYSPKTAAVHKAEPPRGPKPVSQKVPMPQLGKCRRLLLGSHAPQHLLLVTQLARLKQRLMRVLTNVPACIGLLKSQLQTLSLTVVRQSKT